VALGVDAKQIVGQGLQYPPQLRIGPQQLLRAEIESPLNHLPVLVELDVSLVHGLQKRPPGLRYRVHASEEFLQLAAKQAVRLVHAIQTSAKPVRVIVWL
jgi:hypothetical protein